MICGNGRKAILLMDSLCRQRQCGGKGEKDAGSLILASALRILPDKLEKRVNNYGNLPIYKIDVNDRYHYVA